MDADRDASPVPDIVLERYRLGELPRHEIERLESRMARDATLRARVSALDASDADIHVHHGGDRLLDAIRRRLADRDAAAERRLVGRTMPPGSVWTAWVAPGAVAVVLTALIAAVALTPDRMIGDSHATRPSASVD